MKIWIDWKSNTLMLLCLLAVSACGPRYEVKETFEPPVTAEGLSCTQNCQSIEELCHSNCRTNYTQCTEQAWQDARLTLPTALQIYAVETASYSTENAMYLQNNGRYIEIKTGLESKRDKFAERCHEARSFTADACKQETRLKERLDEVRLDFFARGGPLETKPVKPQKPSIKSEANYLITQRCQKACNCEPNFRSCYQQCGGQINTFKICVSGCK